jgi:hypothetical protein
MRRNHYLINTKALLKVFFSIGCAPFAGKTLSCSSRVWCHDSILHEKSIHVDFEDFFYGIKKMHYG